MQAFMPVVVLLEAIIWRSINAATIAHWVVGNSGNPQYHRIQNFNEINLNAGTAQGSI
jgi:hypothetical protein